MIDPEEDVRDILQYAERSARLATVAEKTFKLAVMDAVGREARKDEPYFVVEWQPAAISEYCLNKTARTSLRITHPPEMIGPGKANRIQPTNDNLPTFDVNHNAQNRKGSSAKDHREYVYKFKHFKCFDNSVGDTTFWSFDEAMKRQPDRTCRKITAQYFVKAFGKEPVRQTFCSRPPRGYANFEDCILTRQLQSAKSPSHKRDNIPLIDHMKQEYEDAIKRPVKRLTEPLNSKGEYEIPSFRMEQDLPSEYTQWSFSLLEPNIWPESPPFPAAISQNCWNALGLYVESFPLLDVDRGGRGSSLRNVKVQWASTCEPISSMSYDLIAKTMSFVYIWCWMPMIYRCTYATEREMAQEFDIDKETQWLEVPELCVLISYIRRDTGEYDFYIERADHTLKQHPREFQYFLRSDSSANEEHLNQRHYHYIRRLQGYFETKRLQKEREDANNGHMLSKLTATVEKAAPTDRFWEWVEKSLARTHWPSEKNGKKKHTTDARNYSDAMKSGGIEVVELTS